MIFLQLNTNLAIITKSIWLPCWAVNNSTFWKIHGKSLAKITSCMECVLIQSRTADNIMVTRRSKANKCGSRRMGWSGSSAKLSLINCDSGFGPFWNLKPSCKHSKMRFEYHPSHTPPTHIPPPTSSAHYRNAYTHYTNTIPVKREILPQQCF